MILNIELIGTIHNPTVVESSYNKFFLVDVSPLGRHAIVYATHNLQ